MAFDLNILKSAGPWDLVGVTSASISTERQDFFLRWIKNKKGPQMHYLERRAKERLNPKAYFQDAESVICFGLYYFPGWAEGPLKFSNYSWGQDYHEVLKEKLSKTEAALLHFFPNAKLRSTVDTAPVLEKVLAAQSGIGWQGKNTLLINPQLGSMIFLAEIFSSIPMSEFEVQSPMKDHCGTCTRCLDACPTKALKPYELDASKCVSYWTLEHKGPFGDQTPHWENWLAGCDICQEVCPWNSKLIPLSQDNPYLKLSEDDIRSTSLQEELKDKALSYIPTENWIRNLGWLRS